jgi:hypothetical protein
MKTFIYTLKAFTLLAFLLLTGCTTTGRYQITVGNGNPKDPVRNVEVSADNKPLRTFNQITAQKTGATKPRNDELPQMVTLNWVDSSGTAHSGEINLAEAVDKDFTGYIAVQINPDHTLRLDTQASVEETFSPIPWNSPEDWEGSISIPGFNE